jgi:hypothetical protein
VDGGVNWGELARSTDEFGGAMLKAVCVEAGMIALRSGKNKIGHEHYVDAIAEVQAKKKDVSTPQGLVFRQAALRDEILTRYRRSTFTPKCSSAGRTRVEVVLLDGCRAISMDCNTINPIDHVHVAPQPFL